MISSRSVSCTGNDNSRGKVVQKRNFPGEQQLLKRPKRPQGFDAIVIFIESPFNVNLTLNIQNNTKKPRIKNLIRKLKIKGHDEASEKIYAEKICN